jgi:XTP/dITP diphosphohydrolase
MTTLILATRNAHKAEEIRAILGDGFRVLGLDGFPHAPALVEDAGTFEGNAIKKARGLIDWLGQDAQRSMRQRLGKPIFVLADDSGLEVEALGGAPGVHSARFAALDGPGAPPEDATNSPDAVNNAKLLRLLKDVPRPRRKAQFRCVLALVELPPKGALPAPLIVEGTCKGRIDFEPHGVGGFGYDPLFIPAGCTRSFAELGEPVKNRRSHRAQALARLREFLQVEPAISGAPATAKHP